jgi:inhibitor of KinA sporulation pathway (predicted exonuclease)
MSQKPPPDPNPPTFDTLVVLDFEATCQQNKAIVPQEVIEFPSVLVSLRTRAVVDSFTSFVRPVHHPQLGEFCRTLTGIEQADVDAAPTFAEVLARHQAWLLSHGLHADNFAFVTCGDWDLVSMLPRQCELAGVPVTTLPPSYRRWINIKQIFTKTVRKSRAYGMTSMLQTLHLKLEGRHHRGIDDCQNIARIALTLADRGASFSLTNRLPAKFYPALAVELHWQGQVQRATLDKRLRQSLLALASNLFHQPMLAVHTPDGREITDDTTLAELPPGAALHLTAAPHSEPN